MFTVLIALFCATIIAFLIALFAVRRLKNYPPGPLFLPILGSIYAVPGQGSHLRIEEWRKKYGNIIGHKYGPSYEIYVTGIEESLAAMKHPNFQGRKIFHHRNSGLKRGLFFNDGAKWAILKRFTLNYFSEYQKIKIEDLMMDEMKELFSRVVTDSVVEISYKFFPIGINIIMRILAGVTKENRDDVMFDKILIYTYKSLHETRPTGIENYFPLIRKLFFKHDNNIPVVQRFLKKCINEHRSTLKKDQPRDFIDAFLIEQEDRRIHGEDHIFTDEELISDCYDLVRAGSISTSDTIGFVMLYLVLHPDVQQKLVNEIDANIGRDKMPTLDDKKKLPYCEAVVAESMRINPIVPFTAPHRATEDTEFYGFTIPRDTVVKVSLWTLFRDPKLWDDPEAFIPERFITNGEFVKCPYHLPFGLGKRSCLMEVMARNMIFLYLSSFFQKFTLHQPAGEPLPSTEAVQGSVTGPKPFKVLIKNRN